MKIQYDAMLKMFEEILVDRGFNEGDAYSAAKIFADNSLDGKYSHGVNRFPRTVSYIEKGYISPNNHAVCEQSFGSFERWNGNEGFGPLNAKKSMDRAVELAKENGIGMVAIRNTNHWMRGGTYGWQAAEQGCIGICWTNTMPNMPAWGAKDVRIGNNPFIMAVPRSNGQHLVLDFAMSQYSYGKLEEYRLKGDKLPFQGGYDTEGNLTDDPSEIEESMRLLPIGFWKGSGFSIALDLIATVLSGGNSVKDIGEFEGERQISQVFIAIDSTKMDPVELSDKIINETVDYIKHSEAISDNKKVFYPGENSYNARVQNLEEGIPVIESVWEKIISLRNSI